MCKIAWSDQEDKLLLQLKEKEGMGNWWEICQTLNGNGVGRNRTGKQCRERYINHLKEFVRKDCWSEEEEDELLKLYRRYGSQWTKISNQLFGRSQNFVKNKFYGSMRKVVRLLNKIAKEQMEKRSKPIKYESLLKIIQIAEEGWDLQPTIQPHAQELREQIFSIITQKQYTLQHHSIPNLILSIHHFNVKTRCYSLKRKKNSKFKQKSLSADHQETSLISFPQEESDPLQLPCTLPNLLSVKIQTIDELDQEMMLLLGQSY